MEVILICRKNSKFRSIVKRKARRDVLRLVRQVDTITQFIILSVDGDPHPLQFVCLLHPGLVIALQNQLPHKVPGGVLILTGGGHRQLAPVDDKGASNAAVRRGIADKGRPAFKVGIIKRELP